MSRLRIQSIRASRSEAYHGPDISGVSVMFDFDHDYVVTAGPAAYESPGKPSRSMKGPLARQIHPAMLRAQVTEMLSSRFKKQELSEMILKFVPLRPSKK